MDNFWLIMLCFAVIVSSLGLTGLYKQDNEDKEKKDGR